MFFLKKILYHCNTCDALRAQPVSQRQSELLPENRTVTEATIWHLLVSMDEEIRI